MDMCTADGRCESVVNVTCPAIAGVDAPCNGEGVCNSLTGSCEYPVRDNDDCDSCNDGDVCTMCDVCSGGHCVGRPLECPMGKQCFFPNGTCVPSAIYSWMPVCVFQEQSNVPCDDDNRLTDPDTCWDGCCMGTPIQCQPNGETTDCDDHNDCTMDHCSDGACMHFGLEDGRICNDHDACTTASSCWGGRCVGTANLECPWNGNPCISKFRCDHDVGCVPVYQLFGTSCDNEPGEPCPSTGLCDGSGHCTHIPVQVGICGNSDACFSRFCDAQTGLCGATSLVDCDDHNPCTSDRCDPLMQMCIHEVRHNETCSDGNACTVGDRCGFDDDQRPVCIPGGALLCPVGSDDCQFTFCDPDVGCAVQFRCDNEPCDPHNRCITNTHCQHGQCVGEPVDCADTNPCTLDICNPHPQGDDAVCQHLPVSEGTPCEDGLLCTTDETCCNGVCKPGGIDSAPCEAQSTVCAFYHCTAHDCVSIPRNLGLPCDFPPGGDINLCPQDQAFCDAQGGCACGPPPPECVNDHQCSDLDRCTLDRCEQGHCTHDPIVQCDPTACTCEDDCRDGDVCTRDACENGHCVSRPADPADNLPIEFISLDIISVTPFRCMADGDCNDGSTCTIDHCDPCSMRCVYGRVNPEICPDTCQSDADCSDGDPCTREDCDAQLHRCRHAPVANCERCETAADCESDGNPCTRAVCTDLGVCVHAHIPHCQPCVKHVDCVDGLPCTIDLCREGVCAHPRDPLCDVCERDEDCNDQNVCTRDACRSCHCVHEPLPDCEPPPPPCGGCVRDADCEDDGSICTIERCVEGGRCAHVPVDLCESGRPCDGDAECNDGDSCTTDSCTLHGFCVFRRIRDCCGDGVVSGTGEHCDDGRHCNDGTPCVHDADCDGASLCLPRAPTTAKQCWTTGRPCVSDADCAVLGDNECSTAGLCRLATCDAQCGLMFCGDGIVQPLLGEQCEPPASGCSRNCTTARVPAGSPSVPSPDIPIGAAFMWVLFLLCLLCGCCCIFLARLRRYLQEEEEHEKKKNHSSYRATFINDDVGSLFSS
jgi:hypothetical protein